MNMKKVLLFGMAAMMLSGIAQSCKSTQIDMQQAAAEKQVYKMLDSISAVKAAEAMQNLDFVINGQRVTIGSGRTFNCDDQSTNFVSVHDGKAMLQLASMRGMSGFNGIGGITLEGRITKTDLKTDKKGNMSLTFSVSGPSLSAFVTVSLPKNSTQAIVQINPNFRRDLTMFGTLSPYDSTKIYVGSKPF